MDIGKAVAVLRASKGITQIALAKGIGLKDEARISKIEKGANTSWATLEKIADFLEVPLVAIFLLAVERKDTKLNAAMYKKIYPLWISFIKVIFGVETKDLKN